MTSSCRPRSTRWTGKPNSVVVIGRTVRRADDEQAAAAIAGFTVMNDVTMRDWQFRTAEWLQGKTFEATTPLGPVLVTPDELPGRRPTGADDDLHRERRDRPAGRHRRPRVRPGRLGAVRLDDRDPAAGRLIATGTPGGVGHARTPPRYLSAGRLVVTEIDGIGQLTNVVSVG